MSGTDWFFTAYFSALAAAAGLVLWNDIRSKPNYAVFRGRDEFRLYEAAALLLDLNPEGDNPTTPSIRANLLTLKDAVRGGRLWINDGAGNRIEAAPELLRDQFWPKAQSWVSRTDLKTHASTVGLRPRFLRVKRARYAVTH